jgi:hypothetical protein
MKRSLSRGPFALAALLALGVLVHAMPCAATIYNVTTVAELVTALAAANATPGPDTINMAPGLYLLGPALTPLDVTDDLTVNGGGRPGTVLDGTGLGAPAFGIHASFIGDPVNTDIHATFNDLTIQNFGGGFDFSSGHSSLLLVNRSTITGSNLIGVNIAGGPLQLRNSTLSGNLIGVYAESNDPLLLDNDTIVENRSVGVDVFSNALTVRNTIVAGNGSDCAASPNFADHDINGDGSCGSGFVTAAPLLGALADNGGPTLTRALLTGSPAIDAGSGGEPTDQRGVARPQGTAGDIGAFEWTAFPFTAVTDVVPAGGSLTTDTLGTGATPTAPVQTTVTAPGGAALTIEQGPGGPDFGFIGQSVHIVAVPDATPANPFTIVFVIDASVIPAGQTAATIVVSKNGVAVPPCTGLPGTAAPDPCVASRQTIAGGDAQITVLSSTASLWDFRAGSTLGVGEQATRLEFSVSPSPIRSDAIVRYSLPAAADVDLSLFDPAGRKVATLVSGSRSAGRYSIDWHAATQLRAGLYFARFRVDANVLTSRVVRVN